MEEVLVPIALFAIAPLIVWAVCAYRYKTKKAIMKVLEAMTHKGEPISPAVIHALGIRPRNRNADLRTGIILIALAVAFFLLGAIIGEEDAIRGLSGIAMFPLVIGAAYVGIWAFIGRKEPATFG
ncbi:MAG: DUF6249 domain-containing protein [Litorimonas sp.]